MDPTGYLLDPLREDGEFTLYRARANHPEAPCVLILSPVSTRPTVESLKKINHEYALRINLTQPGQFVRRSYLTGTSERLLCSRILAVSLSIDSSRGQWK